MHTRVAPAPGLQQLTALARRVAWERYAAATVAFSTVFFVVVNCVGLSDPGPEYDELLFVNGALGATHPYQGFIYREALGVPTMLMPYIGALKSWLYYPIFAAFGVSMDSIRIPAVLLAAAAMLLAVALVYRLLGLWAAVALALLLATDPAFGPLARTDWGPIVLSALLRISALLCYFAFLRRHSVRYLWLLVLALALGLFNKLDFVWFIVGLGSAAIVVHPRQLFELARRRRAAVLAPVGALLVVGIAAFVTLILPADRLPVPGSHASLEGRVSEVLQLFKGTFDGSAVYQNMTGSLLAHTSLIGTFYPYILICSAAVAVWGAVVGRRRVPDDPLRQAASLTTFFLVLFLVMAVGLIFTRQATGVWHMMLLWPLPTVLALCLLNTAMHVPIRAPRTAALIVLVVALLALLVTQVRTTTAYVQAYHSNRQWGSFWSTEIYAAARAVSRSAPQVESIITVDWGLGTQIFALGNEAVRDRIEDPWPGFTSPLATPARLESEWFKNRRVIVIYHAQSAETTPSTTPRVESILKSLGNHVHVIYAGRQIEADEVLP